MVLFHGTTQKRGEEILRSGVIKCSTERDFKSIPNIEGSTDGYAYFTTDLSKALYYGNAKTIGNDCDMLVYLFRLDIPYEMLCADLDELKVVTKKQYFSETTVEESLKICKCVRISQDISIIKASYTTIPSTKNYKISDELYELRRKLFDLNQRRNTNNDKECKKIEKSLNWIIINDVQANM